MHIHCICIHCSIKQDRLVPPVGTNTQMEDAENHPKTVAETGMIFAVVSAGEKENDVLGNQGHEARWNLFLSQQILRICFAPGFVPRGAKINKMWSLPSRSLLSGFICIWPCGGALTPSSLLSQPCPLPLEFSLPFLTRPHSHSLKKGLKDAVYLIKSSVSFSHE